MIRVQAFARLHFGLLTPAAGDAWRNIDGDATLPLRRFGGVGLMIEEPSLVLRAEPTQEWSVSGATATRATAIVERFREGERGCVSAPRIGRVADDESSSTTHPVLGALTQPRSPQAISIERSIPEHAGFGSGTQLGLAVAKALAVAAGESELSAVELARRVGRGLRSGVGVHGFEQGGLIVEAGKRGDEAVAPLIVRESIPAEWRIVVVLPECGPGIHGGVERSAFDQLAGDARVTEALCRLVLLAILPALRERDCATFGEALYDFNSRVGELFAPAQGGRYALPQCAEVVAFLRGLGVAGVGQSSWGPALFAIVEDSARAEDVLERVRQRFNSATKVWVTRAAGPAVVTSE